LLTIVNTGVLLFQEAVPSSVQGKMASSFSTKENGATRSSCAAEVAFRDCINTERSGHSAIAWIL